MKKLVAFDSTTGNKRMGIAGNVCRFGMKPCYEFHCTCWIKSIKGWERIAEDLQRYCIYWVEP